MAISPEVYRQVDLKENTAQLCRVVADQVGGHITPQEVEHTINLSNNKGFLVHGIKSLSALERISSEGVRPLTPEGGFASFWAGGWKMFGNRLEGDLSMSGFDTPFFHYSHASGSCLALAVTQRLPASPDGYVAINETIEKQNMHLLIVQRGPSSLEPNKQQLEPIMFNLMKSVFQGNFTPGTITRTSV